MKKACSYYLFVFVFFFLILKKKLLWEMKLRESATSRDVLGKRFWNGNVPFSSPWLWAFILQSRCWRVPALCSSTAPRPPPGSPRGDSPGARDPRAQRLLPPAGCQHVFLALWVRGTHRFKTCIWKPFHIFFFRLCKGSYWFESE